MQLTALGGVQYLLINEWTNYAFDFYQMAVVMLAWGVFYLPSLLKGSSSDANGMIPLEERNGYGANDVLNGVSTSSSDGDSTRQGLKTVRYKH